MSNNTHYIIDFDSTFTTVEALDELAKISLAHSPNKKAIVQQIIDLTHQGMEGRIPFTQALAERLKLLNANKQHVSELITLLHNKVSASFIRNASFFTEHSNNIYIISGGFKEFIIPVVSAYGIKPEHVFANDFVYDDNDNIIGCNTQNVLAQTKGKVQQLAMLQLQGDIKIIGDGYTDYELKEAGLQNTFYLFTENIARANLLDKADSVIADLDTFLYMHNLTRSQSFPKKWIKVLLLENIHANATTIFNEEEFEIETITGALDEKELIKKIKDVHILGIRSKTTITEAVLEHANKLMSIGAYCIGTNQMDLSACSLKGISVYNAPYSNTRSVVELAVGEMIMLMRNVFTKSNLLHAGRWDKSAKNSYEIRGKKLGIIGYGNIGSQLSVLAEALGMKVYFYDVADKLALGNARKCKTLQQLLQIADVISMHVDGRESNQHLIGEKEFALMQDNVIFMNLSRGHVVNMNALKNALSSGKVWGTSIDVYAYEPKTNDEEFVNELRNMPNTIITPHIGGSTEEAQANIGEFVSQKMVNYINKGDTYGSVNFPEVQLPTFTSSHRLLHIHANVPGILAQLNAVFAKYNVNIQAQYLKTNNEIGYVITDVSTDYNPEIIAAIKAIEHTIRFRVLY